MIAAISAVVFLGCKKERSFRGANPGDEIVFGGTAGSASGFRSSKTKGGDGDSSIAGAIAVTGLDSSEMESCVSYDSDADETYFFDWEDFDGGDACESGVSCGGVISGAYSGDMANGISSFGSSDAGNNLFGASENDVQTKTDYSGHKENVGGKTYERIDWKAGDKVRIFGDNVMTSGGAPSEMVYTVTSPSIKPGDARRSSASLEKESVGTMGLRWDSGNADFYAVYPGDSPSKLSVINGLYLTLFDVTVKLPEGQNTFTKTTSGNHTEVRPDMELAAMMAVSRDVPPASSVQLDFLPLVTTFKIKIGNPSTTDDITINRVSIGYSLFSSNPIPMSGDYRVIYDKTGGSTLSSQLQLMPVDGISVQNASFDGVVDLSSVPGGPVLLPKKNGSAVSSMSVTLFAVPLMHKGLQLKINVTQGGNTEDRILNLEKKQTTPFTPADQLEFEPYKKYDINVGIGNKMEYHLEVSSPSTGAPYTGGTLSDGWVRSYKTDGSMPEPAPWRVEGYSETGASGPFAPTPPTWLTGFTPNGNGVASSSGTEPVTANVSAQTPTTAPNYRTADLRGKSEVGSSADPIDLSKVPAGTSPFFSIPNNATASTYTGNPMNTANCYVVTRPGWYKIPVVYGNAIKNNIANTSAYTSSAPGVNVLQNFIRHDEQPITKPWINENSGINLNTGVAELLWQDQKDLVQSIQLQPDKKYIVFHIDKATIHEGNAVIVLKKSATGDIVWSWHIWVCGSNDLRLINVKNNKAKAPTSKPGQDNFDFLSENLGACYDGTLTIYPESNVWVKVSNGRKTEVIKITRMGYSSITSNYYNIPYYQWGRKDPMLPSDGIIDNKVWYGNTGVQSNILPTDTWYSDGSASEANSEIANTIKHPQTFNTSGYGMDGLYYNLWDTKCNETGNNKNITDARFEPVTKSVYDPCPPGFCLPPNGAFTGFTSTGNTSGNSSELNVSGSFNKGWNFRTVLMGEPDPAIDPTIFFPASGYRDYSYSGGLYDIGEDGRYWSSAPYKAGGGGYALLLYSGSVFPVSGYITSYGHVLRPVREI